MDSSLSNLNKVENNHHFYYDDLLGNTREAGELFARLYQHFGADRFRDGLTELRHTLATELDGANVAVNKERRGQLMLDMQQISIVRSLVAQAEELCRRLQLCGIEPDRDAYAIAESIFALTSAPLFAKNLFNTIDTLPKQLPVRMLPLYDAFREFLAQTSTAIWTQGVEAQQSALEQIDQKREVLAYADRSS